MSCSGGLTFQLLHYYEVGVMRSAKGRCRRDAALDIDSNAMHPTPKIKIAYYKLKSSLPTLCDLGRYSKKLMSTSKNHSVTLDIKHMEHNETKLFIIHNCK